MGTGGREYFLTYSIEGVWPILSQNDLGYRWTLGIVLRGSRMCIRCRDVILASRLLNSDGLLA